MVCKIDKNGQWYFIICAVVLSVIFSASARPLATNNESWKQLKLAKVRFWVHLYFYGQMPLGTPRALEKYHCQTSLFQQYLQKYGYLKEEGATKDDFQKALK